MTTAERDYLFNRPNAPGVVNDLLRIELAVHGTSGVDLVVCDEPWFLQAIAAEAPPFVVPGCADAGAPS